jgi:hypothetical protein
MLSQLLISGLTPVSPLGNGSGFEKYDDVTQLADTGKRLSSRL